MEIRRKIKSIVPGEYIFCADDYSGDPEDLALVISSQNEFDGCYSHWTTFTILFRGKISTVDLLKNDVVKSENGIIYVNEYYA